MAQDHVFQVTIHTRTAAMGERDDQERHAIVKALHDIAGVVGSSPMPSKAYVKDSNGVVIGSYGFGAGAVNSR